MQRTALIDADILLHEIGWSGQFIDKDSGEEVILNYDRVGELLDDKIKLILEETDSAKAILFITSSERICRMSRHFGPSLEHVDNFRYAVATTKPYKGNRKNPKPFHFYNLIAHMLSEYEVVVSTDGYEADDMICMAQTSSKEDTIICSRDKDLRICEGWHYSWECGKQSSIGPIYTDRIGWLERKTKLNAKGVKVDGDVFGFGLHFFFFQMLAGDAADNIPGLEGVGQVKAYNFLKDETTELGLFNKVRDLYKEVLEENSKEVFIEQAKLLWMTQEKGKFYGFPKNVDVVPVSK